MTATVAKAAAYGAKLRSVPASITLAAIVVVSGACNPRQTTGEAPPHTVTVLRMPG